MNKKKDIFIFCTLVAILVVALALPLHFKSHSNAILDAKITSDNSSGTTFVTIYDNGKIKKSNPPQKKNFTKAIEIDPQAFEDHTDKNNKTYITVNTKILNKNKSVASDATWIKFIKLLAKKSKHSIIILDLFKLNNDYYAFLKYNAGLSDEGTLYQYKSQIVKVATLNSGKISGLRTAVEK